MSDHPEATPPAPAPAAPSPAPALSFNDFPDDVKVTLQARGVTPDAQGFKALAEQYHNANRYILTNGATKDLIGVPGEKATPETWDKVYTALGRPARPDDYQVQVQVPQGAAVDENFLGFGKQLMHKFGVPAGRAQEFVNEYLQFTEKQQTAEMARQDAVINEIKVREGAAFDAKVAKGQQVVKALQLPAPLLGAIEKQLGTGPMLQLFMALGTRAGEGSFLPSSGGGAPTDPSQMDAGQAQREIDRLLQDEKFNKAYYGAQEPGHAEALKQMEALYAARSRR